MKNPSFPPAVENSEEKVVTDLKARVAVKEPVDVVQAEVATPVAPEPVSVKPVIAIPVTPTITCVGPVAKVARTKKVEFFPCVTVVLIPSLTEYRQADLCKNLYWSPGDLRQFHINLSVALQKYMVKCAYSDKKLALKNMMVDPDFEMEDARLVY